MTQTQMAEFFERTRQATLLTTTAHGTASGVPVWFDWDGETVRMFSNATAPKTRRIAADPRISVLVSNDIDEPPRWVCFEGRAEIDPNADAKELAVDVLAPRYWDLNVPDFRATVEQWSQAPDGSLVVISLVPDSIRSSA